MDRILVIVPTYNEAANIGPLVDGIREHVGAAHVLFVDDNSQDTTRAEIAKAASAHPGVVHLLPRERKLGLGTAYVAGFKWGLARGYQAIVEMDADHSHRAVDLAKICDALDRHPVVVGSRYIAGGGTQNWNTMRRLISIAGSLYARTVLRLNVRDLTGGFNGWRRDVLDAISPDSIRSEGYTFQIELKFRAHLAGYQVHELPILFVERRAGESKMSSGIVFEAMYRVWLLAFKRGVIRADIAARAMTATTSASS